MQRTARPGLTPAPHWPWWFLGPLGLGLLLCTAQLGSLAQDPALGNFLFLDAQLFADMARELLQGNWLLAPGPYPLGPLYAYALAACWGLLGHSNWLVFCLQSLVGLCSIWLVTSAAAQIASRRAACVAGCAFALYGPVLMLEAKLCGETLALCLTLASVRLLHRTRAEGIRAATSGALFGLACLARPDLLLTAPFILGALFTLPVRPAVGQRLRLSHWQPRRASLIQRCLPWGVGLLLALSPATARNWAVLGEASLISAQGGVTFFQGNNPQAEGSFSIPTGSGGDKRSQEREAKTLAEAAKGRALTAREVNAHWYSAGLRFLMEDPARASRLMLRKLGYWFSSLEPSADYSLLAQRCMQPDLWLASAPFGLFLVAAIFGVGLAWKRRPRATALHLAFALSGLLVGLLFYVSSRYRVCAAAHLAVFVGPALDALWPPAASAVPTPRSARKALLIRGELALGLVLLTLAPWTDGPRFQAANQLRNVAFLHYSQRQPQQALPLLLTAREVQPLNWDVRYSLAHTFALLGDYHAAVEELKAAARIRPQARQAHQYLRRYQQQAARATSPVNQSPTCKL